jgi:hypothetical protein
VTALFPCLAITVLIFAPPISAVAAEKGELRDLATSLPGKLKALYKENEEGFAGSTVAMSEASYAIGEGLLPELMKLVAASGKLSAEEAGEVQEEIERDARGVAANVYYSNHATGWGGTITKIEAAGANSSYIETRICYEVTRIFKDDEDFDLEGWHGRWAAAGGSTGADLEEGIGEDGEYGSGIRIEEGEVKFDLGASGGILELGQGEIAGESVYFYAKAGQTIVLAVTGIDIRLDRVTGSGSYGATGDWSRAIEAVLPESKGGRYRVRFGDAKEAGGNIRMLMEIR